MAFGPNDGFLYIAMGDGGSGNDPGNRAQNLGELLGKVLRIDVNADDFPDDPDRNYAIPPSNPFLGQAGARPESGPTACGIRGAAALTARPATSTSPTSGRTSERRSTSSRPPAAGENYGWRLKEATRVTGLDPLDGRPLVDPIHEYDHSAGRQAVIGGYVYRGPSLPELNGTYFFADHSGPIWSLRWSGVGASDLQSRESELFPDDGPASISSFGEDAAGELYLVNLTPGEVYRIARKAEAGVAPPAARATAARRALPKRGRFRSLRWTKAARAPAAPSAARVARAASAEAIARAVAELGIPEVEDARTPVEEARFLLQAAAEVEHALLVQYLYGAYSLHVPAGAGVRDWRNWIVQIAREEMGHLLTVQNLLLAIGGSLHLDREDPTPDPDQAQAYPFPLRLQPLTLSSLAST